MKLEELKDKKILIVGMGIEGQAMLKFLKHFFPDKDIGTADMKDDPDYLARQNEYDIVIKSPNVSPSLVAIPYTTATNIFFANVKGMIIGVTGTKGKSTTASLIFSMLKQAGKKAHLAGNIGTPMLEELLKSNDNQDIWILELSSYQLADLEYSPYISLIINLYPDHMDYHQTVERYYEAKKRMLQFATKNDFYVYNPAFSLLKQWADVTCAQAIPFVTSLPFDPKIIPLLGEHNVDNVRAAVTVGKILQMNDADMREAVKNFTPLPHRLENIGTYQGITFYDDAIGTTPQATIYAIQSLPKIGTIFLGGQDRGYDFHDLTTIILQHHIPNLVLFPESGPTILRLLKEKTQRLPTTFEAKNMHDAVAWAYDHTPKETICLLSTASPSYTLWKNFVEKGDEFQKEVKSQSAKDSETIFSHL